MPPLLVNMDLKTFRNTLKAVGGHCEDFHCIPISPPGGPLLRGCGQLLLLSSLVGVVLSNGSDRNYGPPAPSSPCYHDSE